MTSGPGTMYINRLRLHLCICVQVLGSRRILRPGIRWEFDPPLVPSKRHLGTHSFCLVTLQSRVRPGFKQISKQKGILILSKNNNGCSANKQKNLQTSWVSIDTQ